MMQLTVQPLNINPNFSPKTWSRIETHNNVPFHTIQCRFNQVIWMWTDAECSYFTGWCSVSECRVSEQEAAVRNREDFQERLYCLYVRHSSLLNQVHLAPLMHHHGEQRLCDGSTSPLWAAQCARDQSKWLDILERRYAWIWCCGEETPYRQCHCKSWLTSTHD